MGDRRVKKSLFTPGFSGAVGGARIPGQAPHLLLSAHHLQVRRDTSALDALTRPAEPREAPVYPGGEGPIRTPQDVTQGLGLPYETQRELEAKLRDWSQQGNFLALRSDLYQTLKALAPGDYGLRAELSRRVLDLYKATARFSRRPGREGTVDVVQKGGQIDMFGGGGHSGGGEGSRGGHVVGHTAGGAPKYEKHPTAGTPPPPATLGHGWKPVLASKHGGWSRKVAPGTGHDGGDHEFWYPGGQEKQPALIKARRPKAAEGQLDMFAPRPQVAPLPVIQAAPAPPPAPVVSPPPEVHHVEPPAVSHPPAGYTVIPGSQHGGYHKRVGDKYVYWYPDFGVSPFPHPADHLLTQPVASPAPVEEPHHAPEAEHHEPEAESESHVGADGHLLGSDGRGEGAGGRDSESPRGEAEAPDRDRDAEAGEITAEDWDLLAPEDAELIDDLRGALPEDVQIAIDALPEGVLPSGGTVTTDPDPDKNPAVTLYPELLPAVNDAARLPAEVINFPHPAPLRDSDGQVTGHIEALFPHQIEAAERIRLAWQTGDGVLLSDDAGLGKTNSAMAALVAHGGKRNLIVVPTSGKAGLKTQWGGPTAAGLYGVTLKGDDEWSATEDGYYIASYDELIQRIPQLNADGTPRLDEKGEPVIKHQLDPRLYDGTWDAIVFDESHNMVNPGLRTGAAVELQSRAAKVLYLSATPFTNIKDMHYLDRLGLWDGYKFDQGTGAKRDREEAFCRWAEFAGAVLPKAKRGKAAEYSLANIKNPPSAVPMAAIAATLHVDGLSLKRTARLDGLSSGFLTKDVLKLPEEQQQAFTIARSIIEQAGQMINPALLGMFYTSWARQFWEVCKIDQAIEEGKKARAEGKQVAFFTSFKSANHEHLRAIPRMIHRAADRLADRAEGNPGAMAQAAYMHSFADHIQSQVDRLPKGESAVARLAEAFGGSKQVAEIHGATSKKPAEEQAAYQAGKKKVCVATMARGGTGISLHDTTGEAPRVQINLSLPWSGREFNQVAGRSHRLGSKSDTQMIWMIGDDAQEQHNAAIVAKRLRSMGALTSGDPDLTIDSAYLMKWAAGQIEGSEDPEESAKMMEALAEAGEDVDAEAARDWFKEFGTQRQAGRDVMTERYTIRKEEEAKKAWTETRRAAEQIRQHLGIKVAWRSGFMAYEVSAKEVDRAGIKSAVLAKAVGGVPKAFGSRKTLTYWVSPEGIRALAEKVGATQHKIDLHTVTDEHLDPAKRSDHEHAVDELAKKDLRVIPSSDSPDHSIVMGDTYKWHASKGAFNGIASGYRTDSGYRYTIHNDKLPDLVDRVGGKLTPTQESAMQERKAAEKAAWEARAAEVSAGTAKLPEIRGASDRQAKFAEAVRDRALSKLAGIGASDDKTKVIEWLYATSSARDILDNMNDLGWNYGTPRFTSSMRKSGDWDAELTQIRRTFRMRETESPGLELVWMAEQSEDDLEKGAMHKYIKRVPTGKARPRWRYYYYIPGQGVVSSTDLQAGSKFKATHNGQVGHFEVLGHHAETDTVHVRHDESGQEAHIHADALNKLVQEHATAAMSSRKVRAPKEKKPKPEKAPKEKSVKAKPEKAPTPEKDAPEAPAEAAPPKREPAKLEGPAPEVIEAKAFKPAVTEAFDRGFDQHEGTGKGEDHDYALEAAQRRDKASGEGRKYLTVKLPDGSFHLFSGPQDAKSEPPTHGDDTEVFMRGGGPDGELQRVAAKFVVMEADDLIASHNPETFAKRSDYPTGVQERPYDTDAEESRKVDRVARKVEPSMVINTNPDGINGAPVVTESGVVLGGNGRTMGMQRAYKQYPKSAATIKAYLAKHARAFGISPEQIARMKSPILVRQVEAGSDTDHLRKLGRRLNESLTQGLNPRSAEVALGKNYVTQDVIDNLSAMMDPDESLGEFMDSARSAPFVAVLERSGIIDDFNRGEFVDPTTKLLNDDGRMRVERVLAARMLPDADLLQHMGRALRQNIAKAVPYMIRAEGDGWDIRQSLELAVRADVDMATRGLSRNDKDRAVYTAQSSLDRDAVETKLQADPLARTLLEVIHKNHDKARLFPAGFKAFSLEASRQKHDHGEQASMFARPKVSQVEALRQAFELDKPKAPKAKPAEPEPIQAAPEQPSMFMSLGKAVDPLKAYLLHAVIWEIEHTLRAAVVAAQGKDPDAGKVLRRLQEFVRGEAERDPHFARALGAHPLSADDLRKLIQDHAQARVGGIAKALARGSLGRAFWATSKKLAQTVVWN